MAQKLGLEYKEILKRTRYTRPQMELKAWQRRTNIKNVFAVNGKCQITNVKILLIDDVWTTGSTLRECAYVLKKEGTPKVWAVTLAR